MLHGYAQDCVVVSLLSVSRSSPVESLWFLSTCCISKLPLSSEKESSAMEDFDVGTLSDTSRVKELTWEIGGCFHRMDRDEYIHGPKFFFSLAEWHMYIVSADSFRNADWISIALSRLDYYGCDLLVEFKFEIRNRDGTALKTVYGIKNFKSCGQKAHMRLIPRDDIVGRKNLFGPKGELTVLCELRLKNECGADASTQTEESLFGVKHPSTERERYTPSADRLVQDFTKLLRSEEGSDIIFKVQEKELKAHSFVLDVRIPAFSSLVVSNTGVVTIDDFEPDVFEDFLHYVYTGAIRDRTLDKAFCMYGLARKYQVTELKTECAILVADFLSLETFCAVLTFSLRYHVVELIDLATDFFMREKKEIVVTTEWQNFVVQNPVQANELFIKSILI